jgi:abortive infection bacteriophage resistance protein
MKYSKPPTTFQEQVDILVKRGLIVEDPKKALLNISRINYYRLSSYFPPFHLNDHQFKENTSINSIFELYDFDKKLRSLIFRALENIEITLRTKIAYSLAHKYGPFAYCDPQYYSKYFDHLRWFRVFKKRIKTTHEGFVKEYFKEYKKEKNLPLWIAVEIMSFGQLSIFFEGLKRMDSNEISKDCFGIDEKILSSWIHTLVYLRNLCAHHSRIWNRTLAIKPIITKRLSEWKGISNYKIFCVFLIFKKLMIIPDQWKAWRNDLIHLLEEYNNINTKMMGFPEDWKERFNNL